MAPVIAVQRIGAATARRVVRPAARGIGLAAAVVAEVDRQVAGRRHRQDDDLRHERAARERELDVEDREQRLGRQPDRPARDHRHDRPPDAVHGRERHQRDQDHAHDGQPPAVDLDRREPVGQEHGRADDRRPARACAGRRSRRPRPAGPSTVSITLCSCVFRRRTTTAVVVPVSSISVPRKRGWRASRSLSFASASASARPDGPADGHRVRLQVDVLDRPLRRVQGEVPGERGQAVEREQDVVERPEQGHRVERLDPEHAGDPFGPHRRWPARPPGPARRGSPAPGRRRRGTRSCRRRTSSPPSGRRPCTGRHRRRTSRSTARS